MKNKNWTLLASNVRSRLINALGAALGLLLVSGMVDAQVPTPVPTTNGAGRVTTSVSPAVTGTPVQHTGGGSITTGVAPASTPAQIVETPVQHIGGGSITTCADLQLVKAAFGSKHGQATYNPLADVNNDGVVNIVDLSTVSRALPPGTVCK